MLNRRVIGGDHPGIAILMMFSLVITGCHLDGTSLRLDSDSRIPFFGFQLSANDREQPHPSTHTSAVRSQGTGTKTAVVSADRKPAGSLSWRGLFSSPGPPKRIPLAITRNAESSQSANDTGGVHRTVDSF